MTNKQEPKTIDLEPSQWVSETKPLKPSGWVMFKANLLAGLIAAPFILFIHLFVAPNAGTKGMWCAWGWEKHCAIFDHSRRP